ncbi:TetR/AcrR family transcriptional regulator [Pseudonocardia nigra]|uniref:TetR/AcrR family transcriptional regulator n=1 Tax=Pseudonocardia nigra TaxID=1921578 RepID=UPI001C606B9D|nr:TetR/AcrR family transcriptional regulator [Pseudonocardia nigra]
MTTPGGRREARKAATRRAIQEHALRLFLAQGYDATTVEQISSAAGVSHMTFFRHFPTKESVVDTDDHDPMIAALIRDRPPDEEPVTAIHRAILQGLAAVLPDGRDVLLERTRLVLSTPALRARQADNQLATRRLFASALADRAGLAEPTYRMQVLAAAALAALTTALAEWSDGGGATALDALVDEAFTILRAARR